MEVPWALPDIGSNELSEVTDCVESTWVTMGPRVSELEEKLADYIDVNHAIAVNSGTAALDVALKSLEIDPQDEVIVPAMTYIATANAVRYQHANPVFADINSTTYTLDPESVRQQLSEDSSAILPIDYGGQCADYEHLQRIAEEEDIALIGDAAESLSASYDGEMAGSLADISVTSFHAAKLMTSVEGGMIFTDDAKLAERCRIIRNQGEHPEKKYHHQELGHNYRLSDLHAAVGLAQFDRLDEIIDQRETIAEFYMEHLQPISDQIVLPTVSPQNEHAWFLFSILSESRDLIRKHLNEHGISTRVTWPLPAHKQPVYSDQHGDETYPISESFANGVLSLPMYHSMNEEEMKYVVERLIEAVDAYVDDKYELE